MRKCLFLSIVWLICYSSAQVFFYIALHSFSTELYLIPIPFFVFFWGNKLSDKCVLIKIHKLRTEFISSYLIEFFLSLTILLVGGILSAIFSTLIFLKIITMALIAYLVTANYYFSSMSFLICKLRVKKHQWQILFNNITYIIAILLGIQENIIFLRIIAGLFLGIDSLIFIRHRSLLFFYLFKIDLFKANPNSK